LLLKSINNLQVCNKQNSDDVSWNTHNWANNVTQNVRKILNQRAPFEDFISKAINIRQGWENKAP
jgi:predicted component of type VI protein secretion system